MFKIHVKTAKYLGATLPKFGMYVFRIHSVLGKYTLRSNSLRSTERKLFSSYVLQFTMICKVDEDMVGCSHNPNCFYLLSVIQYKHTKHY